MIFFLPLFCRKISSSISRHSAKKNLLENIRIVSSSLRRKQDEVLSSTKTLKIFYLTSSWQSLFFHPGWTRDQKILSRELKNSRKFLNLFFFFEKRGQQILAKVGRINITRKYPDKIRLCLKRWILKKYWPKHYNLF